MSNYLSHLVSRTLELTEPVLPRQPARFEAPDFTQGALLHQDAGLEEVNEFPPATKEDTPLPDSPEMNAVSTGRWGSALQSPPPLRPNHSSASVPNHSFPAVTTILPPTSSTLVQPNSGQPIPKKPAPLVNPSVLPTTLSLGEPSTARPAVPKSQIISAQANALSSPDISTSPKSTILSQGPPASLPQPSSTIHISIGRVEVRATPMSSNRPPARPTKPAMGLEDYLQKRFQGG